MGNNCSDIQSPVLRNKISDGVGDIVRTFNPNNNQFGFGNGYGDNSYCIASYPGNVSRGFWGFCAGTADTDVRKTYCNLLGDGEWKYRSSSKSCHFNDCNTGEYQPSGCCGWCCGIVGKGTTCSRVAFNGDPIACCLNDYQGCGVSGMPGDTCKANLAFSMDADGNPINTSTVGGTEYTLPTCTIGNIGAANCSNVPEGWSCLNTNCRRSCGVCNRSITTDQNSFYISSDENNLGSKVYCKDVLNEEPDRDGYVGCRKNLLVYCAGEDLPPGDTSWMDRWWEPDGTPKRFGCLNVLVRNIFDSSTITNEVGRTNPVSCQIVNDFFEYIQANTGYCTPYTQSGAVQSADGVQYARTLMNRVGARYATDGFRLGAMPGDNDYNDFQSFLYTYVVCPFPYVAQELLNSSCSIYTTEQLMRNPSIANWCGCYLQDGEYQRYVNEYQIDKECTPMCNYPGTIPIVNATNVPLYCQQDTCIIDDVSISLANVNVNGSINVNQMCNNCSQGGSCSCRIDQSALTVVGGNINNVNTNEICTSLECTVINPNTGQAVSMNCSDIDQSQEILRAREREIQRQRQAAVRRRNFNLLLVVMFLAIAIVIAALLLRPTFEDPEERKIKRRIPDEPKAPFGSLAGKTTINPPLNDSFASRGSITGKTVSPTFDSSAGSKSLFL